MNIPEPGQKIPGTEAFSEELKELSQEIKALATSLQRLEETLSILENDLTEQQAKASLIEDELLERIELSAESREGLMSAIQEAKNLQVQLKQNQQREEESIKALQVSLQRIENKIPNTLGIEHPWLWPGVIASSVLGLLLAIIK